MIVLDTHVLIWLANRPERLSAAAAGAIEMDEEPAISTITAQEIAYLAMRDKIELDSPAGAWIADALAKHQITPIEPDIAIAVRAGSLEAPFPGDPADRAIYATAVERGARLISADTRLRDFDPARVVW